MSGFGLPTAISEMAMTSCRGIFEPSTASFAYRQTLASSVSALRRVRPRIPFNKLPAHRIPTLWTLYRGILRSAPSEPIRWRVRILFRQRKHVQSPRKCREHLTMFYKWHEYFLAARAGDIHKRKILERWSSILNFKRKKEDWEHVYKREMKWMDKMNNRSIMTGGRLRPTWFNKPLPRLSPQPIHISMMIASRRKAKASRTVRFEQYNEWKEDMKHEAIFERLLQKELPPEQARQFETIFQDREWLENLDGFLRTLQHSFGLDEARARSVFSPQMMETIKQARRRKVENKTRERQRERRGEILTKTLKRMRKRPPPHLAIKMTAEHLRDDAIMREASQGGYSGRVKARLRGTEWDEAAEEGGWTKEQDRLIEDVRTENERRREAEPT